MKTHWRQLAFFLVLVSCCTAFAQAPPPGANYSQGGFGGKSYAINPPGSGSFNTYTASLFREVKDLEVWGRRG